MISPRSAPSTGSRSRFASRSRRTRARASWARRPTSSSAAPRRSRSSSPGCNDGAMHVDERVLAPIRERYGEPERLVWEGDVSERELGLVTRNPRRRHDVTLFVENGDRLALIRKPHFEPGVWRTPGGGVKPGEDFVAGVVREGLEETGADIELVRYLVRTEATFHHGGHTIEWQTHVFAARTDAEKL